jgi:hypothetical protein
MQYAAAMASSERIRRSFRCRSGASGDGVFQSTGVASLIRPARSSNRSSVAPISGGSGVFIHGLRQLHERAADHHTGGIGGRTADGVRDFLVRIAEFDA